MQDLRLEVAVFNSNLQSYHFEFFVIQQKTTKSDDFELTDVNHQ